MSNYNIRNILEFQKPNNNEFFTPKSAVEELLKILKLPKNKII